MTGGNLREGQEGSLREGQEGNLREGQGETAGMSATGVCSDACPRSLPPTVVIGG